MTTLSLSQLAPGIFRDGRPFADESDESRATGLLVPAPSTVAGFIRTVVGQHSGWDWNDRDVVSRAQALPLRGYVFVRSGIDRTDQPILPAPSNAVVYRETPDSDVEVMRLRPLTLGEGEGSDLPTGLTATVDVSADVKPERGYDWWTWPDLESWLCGDQVVPELVAAPVIDERTHVRLDSRKRAAIHGALYVVEYRAWDLLGHNGSSAEADGTELHTWRIRAQVDEDLPLPRTGTVGHLGGERRPAAVVVSDDPLLPEPSARLVAALRAARRITLHLLTPAAFTHGWRPGWLDDLDAKLTPDGDPVPEADASWAPLLAAGPRLVTATVGRYQTVSGWSYDIEHRGPKAGLRLAPAGSTYVFDLTRPLTEQEIRQLWLTTVSDEEQHRRDGFGLAVWGVSS